MSTKEAPAATPTKSTRSKKTTKTTISSRTSSTQQERTGSAAGGAGSAGASNENERENVQANGHNDDYEFPSPSRATRFEEKEELSFLNTRLANYIDHVRRLQSENAALKRREETTHAQYQVNIKEVTDKFEEELKSVRDTLDDVSNEKAALQISEQSMQARVEELEKENDKLKRQLEKEKNARIVADNDKRDAQRRAEDAEARRMTAEDELKKLQGENNKNAKRVTDLQKKLDDETRQRVEMENLLMTAREEIEFRKNTFDQQLTQMSTTVIEEEVDARLRREYSSRLAEQLEAYREQVEQAAAELKEQLSSRYIGEMDHLKGDLDDKLRLLEQAREINEDSRRRLREIENELRTSKKNADLANRQLQEERDKYADDLAARNAELTALREEFERQTREYEDLLELKLTLDSELNIYRSLINEEENRLDIPTPQRPQSPQGSGSGRPRKRARRQLLQSADRMTYGGGDREDEMNAGSSGRGYTDEMHATRIESEGHSDGPVAVIDQDMDGDMIMIENTSNDDVKIGNWVLTRSSPQTPGSLEEYKFHHNSVLKGNSSCTVYSARTEKPHDPPHQYVLKGTNWIGGDEIETELRDTDGKVVSKRVSRRVVSTGGDTTDMGGPSASVGRRRRGRGAGGAVGEIKQEKCAIM